MPSASDALLAISSMPTVISSTAAAMLDAAALCCSEPDDTSEAEAARFSAARATSLAPLWTLPITSATAWVISLNWSATSCSSSLAENAMRVRRSQSASAWAPVLSSATDCITAT
ncbi:hypothetical protein [Zoogloea sp.]|uniref:hypothetical protein n=1 Tax=Zoogloea sp. TaxID=49181 RepID=UPI0035B355DD